MKRRAICKLEVNGFTLIEVLVVMLIVATLVSMLFAGIGALNRYSDRTNAAAQAQSIAGAIMAYRSDNNEWPGQIQSATDTVYDTTIPGLVCQSNAIGPLLAEGNPRRKTYIDIPVVQYTNGCYVDKWGHPYVIVMDENADGTCSVGSHVMSPVMVTSVVGDVAVASWGRDTNLVSERIYHWLR